MVLFVVVVRVVHTHAHALLHPQSVDGNKKKKKKYKSRSRTKGGRQRKGVRFCTYDLTTSNVPGGVGDKGAAACSRSYI